MDSIMQAPSISLPVTEINLCAWFGQAGTGDMRTYHRGSLAHDRSPTASRLPRQDQIELTKVASRVLALAEAGLAELTQRRLGSDDYEYWITVRPRPRSSDANSLLAVLASEMGCRPSSLKAPPQSSFGSTSRKTG
jgi:hypothetical protein